MGRRSCAYAATLGVICALSTLNVQAETTSDLYEKYGVVDTTAYALQDQKVVQLMEDYNSKSVEYNYAVDYNEVLDRLDLPELQATIDNLKVELLGISEELASNGVDMDYGDLREALSEYRNKSAILRKKEALLDKYSGVSKKEVPNYDFAALAQELADQQTILEDIKESSEIGDIDGIYNFMQATYTVKRKFDGEGLMLKALPDTGVLSVFNGTVTYSERNEVTGETIKVDSGDGIVITYRGLNARYVQTDDTVTQYQKIATTGENLYVTLEINGEYYDLNELYGG